jgi:hypothetical protein
VKALSVPVEENVAVNIPLFNRNIPIVFLVFHFKPFSFPLEAAVIPLCKAYVLQQICRLNARIGPDCAEGPQNYRTFRRNKAVPEERGEHSAIESG